MNEGNNVPVCDGPASMAACHHHGSAPLIWNPVLNKGTSWSLNFRQTKGIRGLLPPVVEDLDQQVERVMAQVNEQESPLNKYRIINELAATNQSLFYTVLIQNLEDLLPIIYTPTVGEACMNYGAIYRSPLGMYFSAFHDRGKFRDILDNWPADEVDIIVVTDGGRILGLGDLGTNGMGISVGKIALYVAGAGFHKKKAMPVCLDCGTDRQEMLDAKFYLGEKRPRLVGREHLDVVKEFCDAVKDKWPHCLVQFEDFKTEAAFAILEEQRDNLLCFNDDIQGTGAVVLAGFINGMKVQGTSLRDARVVFFGAGSSACGVAGMIASYLQAEGNLSLQAAYDAIYLVDSKGLVTTTRDGALAAHKVPFAKSDATPNFTSLRDIVDYVRPHALFGLSGSGPAFTQSIIEAMCLHCSRPLIFPLSNPTSKAEITAANAITWSKGTAIFAAGSPFEPVIYEGREYIPGQANNVFIFPGVGFGAVAVKARRVTDNMLLAAAKSLANTVEDELLLQARIYPEIKDLRSICIRIAADVGAAAFRDGVAQIAPRPACLPAFMVQRVWSPNNEKE